MKKVLQRKLLQRSAPTSGHGSKWSCFYFRPDPYQSGRWKSGDGGYCDTGRTGDENLGEVLKAAGCTYENAVKTTCFLGGYE